MNKADVVYASSLRRKALSNRQFQVLGLLLDNLSIQKIASVLHISEKTVKAHTTAIFKAFEVEHRHELLGLALNYCIEQLEKQIREVRGHEQRNGIDRESAAGKAAATQG